MRLHEDLMGTLWDFVLQKGCCFQGTNSKNNHKLEAGGGDETRKKMKSKEEIVSVPHSHGDHRARKPLRRSASKP